MDAKHLREQAEEKLQAYSNGRQSLHEGPQMEN